MHAFQLHPRLEADCYFLGDMEDSMVLLHRNSLVPWFIAVPRTEAMDIHEMDPAAQHRLLDLVNLISRFLCNRQNAAKVNVAAIGNLVPQLHVHIIGRSPGDFCWPGVVWGRSEFEAWRPLAVQQLATDLALEFGEAFCPNDEFLG